MTSTHSKSAYTRAQFLPDLLKKCIVVRAQPDGAVMGAPDVLESLSVVSIGHSADVLRDIARPGVELAAWQRNPDPAWAQWLAAMPAAVWPVCRMETTPDDAARALGAHFDASGTPFGESCDAFVADIASLVAKFAALAAARSVRLRLNVVTGDDCCRWHRDCVPLRLICTYIGPGTLWIPPALVAAALAKPDDDAPQVLALEAGDVALFKGCGWPGQGHDVGVVHRSPRIAGTGITRLVLVLDAVWPVIQKSRA
jgi:hypothetical protein